MALFRPNTNLGSYGKCHQIPLDREFELNSRKARRDSQGSLPKTGINPYLDEIAMEL
jgi:hypothetical protein